MKNGNDSVVSSPNAESWVASLKAALTPTPTPNPKELEFVRIVQAKATPAKTRALMLHMLKCLGGKIPECVTCFDTGSVKCDSGWCGCPDCRG